MMRNEEKEKEKEEKRKLITKGTIEEGSTNRYYKRDGNSVHVYML